MANSLNTIVPYNESKCNLYHKTDKGRVINFKREWTFVIDVLNLSKTFLILYVTFGDKIAELFDQLIDVEVVSLPKYFFCKIDRFLRQH